jgi:hypothetical protein
MDCRSAEKGGMENPRGRSFVNIALTKYSSAALRGRLAQYALISYVYHNVIMIITFYMAVWDLVYHAMKWNNKQVCCLMMRSTSAPVDDW